MPISDRPVFTDIWGEIEKFSPAPESIYVWGRSAEERSLHVERWAGKVSGVQFHEVTSEHSDRIVVRDAATASTIRLRSERDIDEFWRRGEAQCAYLDVTGLRHGTWAPLLRRAMVLFPSVTVVYVEPQAYQPSGAPTDSSFYDLSEKIEGISPLPGFAHLRGRADQVCFVPMLGFEGTRFAYLVSQLEPPGGKVVPIVGLPGFRIEYPFTAYFANRLVLMQTQAWKQVRYAASNCPFDAFYALEQISEHFPDHTLQVAPIGTKPHAVGAVLFALSRENRVELVYDHPIRKQRRTLGMSKLLTFRVSALHSDQS